MAFSAADFGFFYILVDFPAVGIDLDLLGEKGERPLKFRPELHKLTGICPENSRHRAIITKAGLPG